MCYILCKTTLIYNYKPYECTRSGINNIYFLINIKLQLKYGKYFQAVFNFNKFKKHLKLMKIITLELCTLLSR